MPSLLIIEDDQRIREALVRMLTQRGHEVRSVSRGMDGIRQVVEFGPEVVILDLGLPDVDGSEVVKMIRATSSVPILVATARDEEGEIVRILDDGADDYVVKPFSAAQIDARIRAILRRTSTDDASAELVVGTLRIDPATRQATVAGDELELTRKEFDLLAYLAARAGTVVTKREILAGVWRQPYGGADKTVDVHLSWLRRKLGESAAEPRFLRTVRGVGVRLVDPDEVD
ncbi:MAG: response regulator transcription factor [Actinobacteria bacterium]|nr:response regulator transcription factor [Actinomycetota bacterium]MCB9389806.1 response regulator transcription factor [Acidimicrobiia bacterium]